MNFIENVFEVKREVVGIQFEYEGGNHYIVVIRHIEVIYYKN